ncbi:MAG: hypothetical protein ACLUT4_05425 [Lachnospiraceae bacterium]
MDDYRQPDTPETANEVEMLLDQQAEQAVSSEASKETSADMKAEPVNLEEIVQPKEQLEEVKEQPEELMEEAQEQPEESELTELTKEQPEESEQAELKEKQLDELDAASTEESQEGSMESSMEVEAKPEDEATREAQSSVFGQAVTLDAIHDSELIKTVNRAKQLLNDLDEAEKDKTRLTGELKQSEKAYSSMEKSVAEGITTALKKKKEEIAATYDRELSQYQDQIDVCKTERAKAKANAIAQRIQVETAPLNQQNQQLEAQIELKFKENKVPVVCKKRAISMLFFPKNSRDWTIDILVGVGLIFFIPLFFSLAISNRLVLAFTFFVYVGALFTVYLYLLHKYMLKFAGVNEEVEELRKQIRINNKNKQLMTNRIKKSQDETGYNLGSFDDKITSIQQVMQNTVEKRQEALENFESEIRHQITADITAANKDELLGLQQEFESKRQELSDKKEEIEQIENQLKEEYEPVFGKDLLYKQRLNKFDSFCQENADLSLEEALTQYRALSGSKLLKK